jgi:hypothetical protein
MTDCLPSARRGTGLHSLPFKRSAVPLFSLPFKGRAEVGMVFALPIKRRATHLISLPVKRRAVHLNSLPVKRRVTDLISLPFKGRAGVGMVFAALPQSIQNHTQHRIRLTEHLIVPEPQYSEPCALQKRRTRRIRLGVLGMLPAIELHNHLSVQAYEIEDVITKRVLPAELAAVQMPTAKVSPKMTLGIGGSVAQTALKLRIENVAIGLALHGVLILMV